MLRRLITFVLACVLASVVMADMSVSPASPSSAPASVPHAEPLPQSGCIVSASRCSCFRDGVLRPSDSCPASGRSISLAGIFQHAEPRPVFEPLPERYTPAPTSRLPRPRLGIFPLD